MKSKIKHLSANIVAKIAAGQVVERPASVVKELIENSLDAGAKNIRIELEQSGTKKIIVIDDGCGMDESDLQLCFKHHTTSKISVADDLFNIATFGFRGEAISSIAAVAKIRIESKVTESLAGKYIELVEGTVTSTGSLGMPTGTRVIVSGLFSNVPARKKFLKSQTTELGHTIQVITGIVLANKNVSFSLVNNKKVIFEVPAKQTILERSSVVLSEHIAQNLLPIEVVADHFKIQGFLGKPQIGTPSKQRQFLFVNGRSVVSTGISKRLKEVFSTLLEPRSNPAFILSIDLEYNLVDVNVDPQKTQVKFVIEKLILNDLEIAAKEVLENANLTYAKKGANGFYEEYNMDSGIARMLREEVVGWNVKDAELSNDSEILQVHNLYLVAQTKRGLLLIDQHAAHERILYQEFLEAFEKKRGQSEKLTEPIQLNLPQAESKIFQENIHVFKKLGFVFKEKNESIFTISEIPKIFKTRDISQLLQEMLHDIISESKPKDLDVGTHRTLSYLACRTAIKAGEKLTQNERKRLLEKLQETGTKYTCPHGRPVEVEIDLKYLDQLFKRIK